MKDLLGVEELTRVINEFLEPFDIIAEMGTENAYYPVEEKITYSLIMPEAAKDYFMQNFQRLAPDLDCDAFLVSLLHEVGHAETLYLLGEVEECYCRDIKDELTEKFNQKLSEEEEKHLHQVYFDLPDEYEATMWAANYIRNNINQIKIEWAKIRAAVLNFYKLNGVEVK